MGMDGPVSNDIWCFSCEKWHPRDHCGQALKVLRRLRDWAVAQQGGCTFSGGHPIAQAAAILAGTRLAQPAQPVAWMWEYIGPDPIGNQIKPCARAMHEMDPHNPPHPSHWKPLYPLFTHGVPGPDGSRNE